MEVVNFRGRSMFLIETRLAMEGKPQKQDICYSKITANQLRCAFKIR